MILAIENPKRLSFNSFRHVLAVIIVLTSLLASINLSFGFAGDIDGHFVLKGGHDFPTQGFQRSRSWGFPAYELAIYPIIHHFGAFYAKLYSMLFYSLASIAFFFLLWTLTSNSEKSLLGTFCLIVLPISIVSGNTTLETSQGIFFAILGLYFYTRFSISQDSGDLHLMATFLGVATSTRPDYVLLSLAMALTILKFSRKRKQELISGTLVWTMFALLPFLLYGRVSFNPSVVIPDPFPQKIMRALLGGIALLGIPALTLTAFWILKNHTRWYAFVRQAFEDHFLFLFVVSLLVYFFRFAMLPDELEYIYILVPLFIAVIVRLGVGRNKMLLLIAAIALPNVVQVHFFSIDKDANIAVDIGISPGAIKQDKSMRLLNEYANDKLQNLMELVSRNYGFDEYSIWPSNRAGELVILPEERLRFYHPDRHGGAYYRAACTQTLIVYPIPSNRGWRHFMKFEEWHEVKLEDFREVRLTHCDETMGLSRPSATIP